MMKPAFYAGATGLTANQRALDTIGNNLANTNTVGFKSEGVSFQALLSDEMYVNAPTDPLAGTGARAVTTGLRFDQGDPYQTNSKLDFAIVGDGLFGVEQDGQQFYTRDGNFIASVDGDTLYLTTQSGGYVLDESGSQIEIPYVSDAVDEDGNSKKKDDDEETYEIDYRALKEQIGVYKFGYPGALEAVSGNLYRPTALSGEAEAMEEGTYDLLSGYLEGSGTSLLDEITNLISVQRSYQLCARVVQTADDVEQTVSNLRR